MQGFHTIVICTVLMVFLRCTVSIPMNSTDTTRSSQVITDALEASNDLDIYPEKCDCARNESVHQVPAGDNLSHVRNVLVHGMMCTCNIGLPPTSLRDDYRYSPGIGSHKLHTRAMIWNAARKICNDEGGHLAIVNSNTEAHILMDIFNRAGPVKGSPYPNEAFLGIHDLYTEGDWVTVLGDSLAKTGYTGWSDKWDGQPDNGGGRQNCGAFMKEGGLDDVACDVPFPFFCEIPLMKVI